MTISQTITLSQTELDVLVPLVRAALDAAVEQAANLARLGKKLTEHERVEESEPDEHDELEDDLLHSFDTDPEVPTLKELETQVDAIDDGIPAESRPRDISKPANSDPTAWASWLCQRWEISVKGFPVIIPRPIGGTWRLSVSVDEWVGKLKLVIVGSHLPDLHPKKEVRDAWEPIYAFGRVLLGIDKTGRLLNMYMSELAFQQKFRVGAR